LEHAGIILSAGCSDSLEGGILAHRTGIAGTELVFAEMPAIATTTMSRRIQPRIDARHAAEQCEPAIHVVEGAGNAGNRQSDVFDAPHVHAGIVLIEHPFRNVDFAIASRSQTQKLQREVLPE